MPDPVLPKHRLIRLVRTQVMEPEAMRREFFTATCACTDKWIAENAADAKALLDHHVVEEFAQQRVDELLAERSETT